MSHVYRIRAAASQGLPLAWEDPRWQAVETLAVANFLPQSSDHRPETHARVCWSPAGLQGIFRVADQYVRCTRTNFFDEVWKDSAVEFFVQPKGQGGYFNFEFNCGGAFLCYYITDHRRGPGGFVKAEKFSVELGKFVHVRSSLSSRTDPEMASPLTWFLQFDIPFAVFEHFVGPLQVQRGDCWRGNFFKCAEEVSHPHWASWAPVPEFNFHLPECFGDLVFD